MDQVLHIGEIGAAEFIRQFAAQGKVALVTDGAAYSLSGAAEFFDPILPDAIRLVVRTPNPKVEEVQTLLYELHGKDIAAFVAVGGGTSTDTTKLLNFAVSAGLSVRELLSRRECPALLPFLAVPTTAGTGAEATRFAVCYDGETKYSIDFPRIRPSHVLLLPNLIASLPPYQKASTNFDAYAQAVESLWAKGATEESREYATRALDFIRRSEDAGLEPSLRSELELQASYWAGRAIDISRKQLHMRSAII